MGDFNTMFSLGFGALVLGAVLGNWATNRRWVYAGKMGFRRAVFGKLWRVVPDDNPDRSRPMKYRNRCDWCNGSGREGDRQCAECDGRGYVYTEVDLPVAIGGTVLFGSIVAIVWWVLS